LCEDKTVSAPDQTQADALAALHQDVAACTRCPRLVDWCRSVALEKVKRFAEEEYWGKPVPSFGDPNARLVVIGLAPAAHGGNRTGRVFTGDRSGDWLYRALYRAGFANQPTSVHRDDGLELIDCYVTATAHCAPPQNKLLPEEIAACRPFLLREWSLMPQVKVIVALGKVGFDAVLADRPAPKPRPKFGHGVEAELLDGAILIGSYHPSQQNTFTGKLTEPMFDAIFSRAKQLLAEA
jgi:uracil-DNA glycosylase family 4